MTRPPQASTTTAAREIAPDVYCLGPRGRTQADVYFVRSGSAWTLIDAGWAKDGSVDQAGGGVPIRGRHASILDPADPRSPDHAGSALELARIWECPSTCTPTSCQLLMATSPR